MTAYGVTSRGDATFAGSSAWAFVPRLKLRSLIQNVGISKGHFFAGVIELVKFIYEYIIRHSFWRIVSVS